MTHKKLKPNQRWATRSESHVAVISRVTVGLIATWVEASVERNDVAVPMPPIPEPVFRGTYPVDLDDET